MTSGQNSNHRLETTVYIPSEIVKIQFLTDFVLTVYAVINSKTIPVLPKMGWHLQESKAVRNSTVRYELLGGICPDNLVSKYCQNTIFPDCYFNRRVYTTSFCCQDEGVLCTEVSP